VTNPAWINYVCPLCGASPGEHCENVEGLTVSPHASRRNLAGNAPAETILESAMRTRCDLERCWHGVVTVETGDA